MAEVRLSDIRIGFDYSAEIDFPAGFLQPEERVRMKLRRFVGDEPAVVFDDSRVGDTIVLELTAAQTADMEPCSYIGEAVIYDPLVAGSDQPLTSNRYLVDCDHSPSE